jgi:hypothetical protein
MTDPLSQEGFEAHYTLTDEEIEEYSSEESREQILENIQQARQIRAEKQSALQAQQEIEQPPTGAQPSPQTTPAVSTEQQSSTEAAPQPLSGKTVTFNNGKTYAVEHIEYRDGIPFVKPEFNKLYKENQPGAYFGQGLGELSTQVTARLAAPGVGVTDFATDAINTILPKSAQIPKTTKYEDGAAQFVREVSSVVLPTMFLGGLGMMAGRAAQARVGWSLGNTAFMRFLGARGVEAASGVAVGAVSSEYEEDNLTGSIKKMLPPQWDFIPDSMATLDTDSPDVKRQKNINEDLALGFLIPFVGATRKFASAIGEVKQLFSKGNAFTKPNQVLPAITAESPQAAKFIEAAQPKSAAAEQSRKLWNEAYQGGEVSRSWDELDEAAQQSNMQRFVDEGLIDEEAVDVAAYAIRQDEALDELGAYNLSVNTDPNVALKGVHDLYDWNEIGIRTVDDFGIVGASLDAVRVANNYDTVYGRLGSMVSTPAVKYGVTVPAASEEITLGLTRQLKDAGEYGMEGAGWNITHTDVLAQGENLAIELFDPSMGIKELRQILDPYIVKNADGVEYVAEEGYASLFRAMNNYSDDMTGMDIARAQSYLATSLGGQVSDIAEGMRINRGSRSMYTAQERVKENLQYLMKLQRITNHYATKKATTTKRFNLLSKKGIDPKPEVTRPDEVDALLQSIQREVEVFGENLDYLNNTYPKSAEALMELYELTDGRVNSIQKLNDEIQYAFTKFRPIYDGNPEAPNILEQAIRGNFFNSILSAIGSSVQALYGNLGGTIAEPLTYFSGALLRQDMDSLQRGWMAYSAIWDTQKKALPYAGKIFMKASQNPNSVKSQTRLDSVIKFEEKLASYKKIAEELAQEEGKEGFLYLVNMYENMKHMEMDPVFRLTPNTFTGFDGWTNATLANAHARFRAMSELKRLGEKATPERIRELANAEYNSMFDANGIIADKAVKYNSDEIALNLDTDMVKSLDSFLQSYPGARMFFMFPGTTVNLLKQADDYAPLPLRAFQQDLNDLVYTPVDDLIENPQLMDKLLSSRGFDPSQMDEVAKIDSLIDLKNKALGKKAFGTVITSALVTGLFFGKVDITGDGLYDRTAQRSREQNSNWKKRTITVGDARIEYEKILGPGLANWVAAVVNVADNFDMLGEAKTEQLLQKLSFVLGGAVTNQALVSNLRPIVELAAGNSFEANRWSAGMLNSLTPLGGLRSEMGRVLDGGLKLVEDDLKAHLANRNQAIGVVDPANRLPYIYNPVTGKIPNKYTLAQRVWNAYFPFKIHPGQTDEERFLQDIEFNIATSFKSFKGVKLEDTERSELFRIMGEQGHFKKRIKAISQRAESKNTIQKLKEARRAGVTSEETDLQDYDLIHYQLGLALRDAEKLAFVELNSDMRLAIEGRRRAAEAAKREAQSGRISALEELTQTRN